MSFLAKSVKFILRVNTVVVYWCCAFMLQMVVIGFWKSGLRVLLDPK